MIVADLHMHTTCSDGEFSPVELYQRAAQIAPLAYIAVTDHDNTAAYQELSKTELNGPKLITGVELSCCYDQRSVHLLGLGLRPGDPALTKALAEKKQQRHQRVDEVIAKLQTLEVVVSAEEVFAECATSATAPGRPHIARALIKKGFVRSIDEAFARYLGDRAPAYVPSPRFSFEEARQLVHGAGGKLLLAHPSLYFSKADPLVGMMKQGLDGIEAFHPAHSNRQVRLWNETATKFGLLVSGGSDFHSESWAGKNHGKLGAVGLTSKYLEPLLEAVSD